MRRKGKEEDDGRRVAYEKEGREHGLHHPH